MLLWCRQAQKARKAQMFCPALSCPPFRYALQVKGIQNKATRSVDTLAMRKLKNQQRFMRYFLKDRGATAAVLAMFDDLEDIEDIGAPEVRHLPQIRAEPCSGTTVLWYHSTVQQCTGQYCTPLHKDITVRYCAVKHRVQYSTVLALKRVVVWYCSVMQASADGALEAEESLSGTQPPVHPSHRRRAFPHRGPLHLLRGLLPREHTPMVL